MNLASFYIITGLANLTFLAVWAWLIKREGHSFWTFVLAVVAIVGISFSLSGLAGALHHHSP